MISVKREVPSQGRFGRRFAPVVAGDAGATMVEYAIGTILIALAVTLVVRFFGETVKQKYDCAGPAWTT